MCDRLVEWIEALKAWGVNNLVMYEMSIHPNVKTVLNYYQEEGFLTLIKWANPGTQLNIGALDRAQFDTQR